MPGIHDDDAVKRWRRRSCSALTGPRMLERRSIMLAAAERAAHDGAHGLGAFHRGSHPGCLRLRNDCGDAEHRGDRHGQPRRSRTRSRGGRAARASFETEGSATGACSCHSSRGRDPRDARELSASAMVVGSRGLTGVRSLLLGSASHGIIQHADRPLIVVPSAELAAAWMDHQRK